MNRIKKAQDMLLNNGFDIVKVQQEYCRINNCTSVNVRDFVTFVENLVLDL